MTKTMFIRRLITREKNGLTTPLHASAKAVFNSFESLVEAGLASQVGVKSKHVCWWGGVL